MKTYTNALVLVLGLALVGCTSSSTATTSNGSNSNPSNTPAPSAKAMQPGQWEYTMSPGTGSLFFVETDLVQNGSGFQSAVTNAALVEFGAGNIDNAFGTCFGFTMSVTQTNGSFSATVSEGGTPTFSLTGTITDSGSVSGTYAVLNTTGPCLFFSVASGTFRGSLVPSLTGNYGAGSSTFDITQDQNFNLSGTGTYSGQAFNLAPSGQGSDLIGGYANVIGACIEGITSNGLQFFGRVSGNPIALELITIAPAGSGSPIWPGSGTESELILYKQ